MLTSSSASIRCSLCRASNAGDQTSYSFFWKRSF
ncbi:hypothetical protein B9G39_02985 [Zooshikella ganghwensis]|uniref:Uncharacterized protein n=1 Tax=Zooshikella ganghwensis TaxID=202772 RepID=A0A4P9VKZ5_9GAMM|nr:hypothetical protein B9G39_02985 [Zooshikella ganghwensis]